jgi:hypothetical protein
MEPGGVNKVIAVCLSLALGMVPMTLVAALGQPDADQTKTARADNSPGLLKLDWSTMKKGTVLADGLFDAGRCVLPAIRVYTRAVPGKRRYAIIGKDSSCRLIVVDLGEQSLDDKHRGDLARSRGSARSFVGGAAYVGKRSLDSAGSSRTLQGHRIDAEQYSHGHQFLNVIGGSVALEVHMAFFYTYGSGEVYFDHLALDPPTLWAAPGHNGQSYWESRSADCDSDGQMYLGCAHRGSVSSELGYASVNFIATASSEGETYCSAQTNISGSYEINYTLSECDGEWW